MAQTRANRPDSSPEGQYRGQKRTGWEKYLPDRAHRYVLVYDIDSLGSWTFKAFFFFSLLLLEKSKARYYNFHM